MPTPFCTRPRVGVWAHVSSATVACTLGSSSTGIAVGGGGVDVDNKMIADNKNTLQSTAREEEGWEGDILRQQR